MIKTVYERVIQARYISTGADKLVTDQKRVAKSFSITGKKAQQGAAQVSEWAQRHKTALLMMAAAGLALMGGIIKNSPILNAMLAQTRLYMSLIARQIGQHLAPAFDLLRKGAKALYEAWAGLSPETQKIISYFIGMAAVVLIVIGTLTGLVIAVTAGGMALAVIAGITAGLVIVIGAAVGMFQIWTGEASALSYVMVALMAVLFPYLTIPLLIAAAYGTLEAKTGLLSDAVKFLWDVMKAYANYIITVYTGIFDIVAAVWSGVWQTIKLVIGAVIMSIYYLMTGQTDKFFQVWRTFGNLLIGVWSGVWLTIKNVGSSIWGSIKGLFTTIFKGISGFVDKAYDWGIDLIKYFVNGISDAASSLKDTVVDVAESILKPFINDLPENDKKAMRWGADMVKYFSEGVSNASKSMLLEGPMANITPSVMGGMGGGGNTTSTSNTTINIGRIDLAGAGGTLSDKGEEIGSGLLRGLAIG